MAASNIWKTNSRAAKNYPPGSTTLRGRIDGGPLSVKGRNMTVGQLVSTVRANGYTPEQASDELELPLAAIQCALSDLRNTFIFAAFLAFWAYGTPIKPINVLGMGLIAGMYLMGK